MDYYNIAVNKDNKVVIGRLCEKNQIYYIQMVKEINQQDFIFFEELHEINYGKFLNKHIIIDLVSL